MQILDEIIDAHGGMDLWNSIDELDVVLSSQGFLFTSLMRWRAPVVKQAGSLIDARATVDLFRFAGERPEVRTDRQR